MIAKLTLAEALLVTPNSNKVCRTLSHALLIQSCRSQPRASRFIRMAQKQTGKVKREGVEMR